MAINTADNWWAFKYRLTVQNGDNLLFRYVIAFNHQRPCNRGYTIDAAGVNVNQSPAQAGLLSAHLFSNVCDYVNDIAGKGIRRFIGHWASRG